MALIVFLLLLWLVLAVCGFLLKGLFWLGVFAVAALIITSILGGIHGRS